MLEAGEAEAVICVTGSGKELGNWALNGIIRMVQNQEQDLNR